MDFEGIYRAYFRDVYLYLRSLSAGETLAGHSPISRGEIIAHEQTETDWQQVTFPEGAHLIFDKPFSQRVLVNDANNSGPHTIQPGRYVLYYQ